MKYPVVGKKYLGRWFTLFGANENKSEKIVVEHPVCREHFFWSMGIKIGSLVSYVGIVIGLVLINPLFSVLFLFPAFLMSMGFLILLFSTGLFVLSIVLDPVRIRKVGKDFYTMKIRNEDYAREFGMLNNLSPV